MRIIITRLFFLRFITLITLITVAIYALYRLSRQTNLSVEEIDLVESRRM